MTARKIPPDDHIVRYVRKNQLRKDEDGNVIGILPQALELRPARPPRPAETYLSVTWLEHFSSDYEQGLRLAAEAIGRQLEVKPKDGFAVGGVGQVFQVCADHDVKVRIIHEPKKQNTGYTAWRGMPRNNDTLLDLLAAEAFTDTRIAKLISAPSK